MTTLYSSFFVCVELAAAGIGAHHAGLDLSDRRLVEELFTNRVLRVVVATSVCYLLICIFIFVIIMFLISFRLSLLA